MNNKRVFMLVLLLAAAVVTLNYPLTEEGTIGGEPYAKKMPLYVKACGLVYREWMYKDLAREITAGCKGDLAKVIAIFDWVANNIMPDIPPGLKAVDDYSYNAVIRQYGTKEQVNEVFAILCLTSGIQAGWDLCYNADKSESVIFAFALVDGRWLIFDIARHKYFLNAQGRIASVHDYIKDNVVLSDGESSAYKEYLDDIKEMYGELAKGPEPARGGRFAAFAEAVRDFVLKRRAAK
jgi:hypothetical protein